jgi:hypothetical protein
MTQHLFMMSLGSETVIASPTAAGNARALDDSWPFMLVGITMTKHAIDALRSGALTGDVNKTKSVLEIANEFHHACFYCYSRSPLHLLPVLIRPSYQEPSSSTPSSITLSTSRASERRSQRMPSLSSEPSATPKPHPKKGRPKAGEESLETMTKRSSTTTSTRSWTKSRRRRRRAGCLPSAPPPRKKRNS